MRRLVIQGNACRIPLADRSVQCVVTSPPYFGLRNYGVAGQIGLETTPQAYVAAMVEVFRDVRRVLRDDGTVWLNIGDSFANSSILANPRNCLNSLMEGCAFMIGDASTIRVTSQRGDIPLKNEGLPHGVFIRLFGVKRITVKQRDNDFCQILHALADPCYCRIGVPFQCITRNASDLEIVLDNGYDVRVIISDLYPNRESEFGVFGPSGTSTSESRDSALSIEESGKPVAKIIRDGETIGYPVAFNTLPKCLPDIYLVNETVSFGDRLHALPGPKANFCVTQASPEQFGFESEDGRFDLQTSLVSHLFVLNSFGSFVRYAELYDQAQRKSNAFRAKQELGVPDLLKRALMEDGWFCRSTIIWHKPNPMPESVTDRPTKAHEHMFLLTKKPRYFYDAEAIKEKDKGLDHPRMVLDQAPSLEPTNGLMPPHKGLWCADGRNGQGANARSVWTINSHPFNGAHFAVMPLRLATKCIKAGSRPGDVVFDPFGGAATTVLAAENLGRIGIMTELSPKYLGIARRRLERPHAPRLNINPIESPMPLFDSI
jgi:DNA modification methylase